MPPILTGNMSPLPATTTTLRLFNTLSGQVDELVPSDRKELRMYACGPTVYDYGHIGNFRTFLEIDVLRRFLKLTGMPVRHVMNITDVDDKIIRNAAAAGDADRRVHGEVRECVLRGPGCAGSGAAGDDCRARRRTLTAWWS